MSEIVKTEAIVLNKLNYGDTSSIACLYTKDYGKLSVILKGGRNPRSKMGSVVDPLNHLHLVIYKKDSREVQLISSADIISHFSKIKDDYNKLKYSQAIIELVKKLTIESEVSERLFRGIIRILNLLEASNEPDEVLFSRFFLFFLKETGFELQFEKCSTCGKTNLANMELSWNFQTGILCQECSKIYLESFRISPELFNYLMCLKHSKNALLYKNEIIDRANIFLEKFLMFHFPDFKGIQSFQLLK